MLLCFNVNAKNDLPFEIPSDNGIIKSNEDLNVPAKADENRENDKVKKEAPVSQKDQSDTNKDQESEKKITYEQEKSPPLDQEVIFVDANFEPISKEQLKQMVLHDSRSDLTQSEFYNNKGKNTPAQDQTKTKQEFKSIGNSSKVISADDFKKFKH